VLLKTIILIITFILGSADGAAQYKNITFNNIHYLIAQCVKYYLKFLHLKRSNPYFTYSLFRSITLSLNHSLSHSPIHPFSHSKTNPPPLPTYQRLIKTKLPDPLNPGPPAIQNIFGHELSDYVVNLAAGKVKFTGQILCRTL